MKLNNENYKEHLNGISVVEVSGESCANCLTLMPILHRLVSNRTDCELHHIEAGYDTTELLDRFQIETIPTILVLNGTEVCARCRGFQPEEILELWLDAKIEEIKNKNA